MKDSNTFNLEKYRLSSDDILYSKNAFKPDNFIGYENVESFFGSLIPNVEFDDNENIYVINEFKEMYPGIYPTDNRVTSSAVMFSGEFGCGKHSADKVLLNVTLSRVQDIISDEDIELDDVIECYAPNISDFTYDSPKDMCKHIENVMDIIIDIASSNIDMMYYFSLGDVTEIMNHKKTAKCFSSSVKKLLLNHKTTSIITCCYNGSASKIKDIFKQPFYVYEFEPPNYILRKTYFEQLRKNYNNIIIEPDDDKLAFMTEDFTFAMLKKLTAFVLTDVKYSCVKSDSELDENDDENKLIKYLGLYDNLNDDDKILVETSRFEHFINIIKKVKYVKPEKQSLPVYTTPQNIVVTQQSQVFSESAESPQYSNKKEEAEDKAMNLVTNCNTIAEWKSIVHSLVIPAAYIPDNSEESEEENQALEENG